MTDEQLLVKLLGKRNGQRLLCGNFVRYILYHNSDENQYSWSFE